LFVGQIPTKPVLALIGLYEHYTFSQGALRLLELLPGPVTAKFYATDHSTQPALFKNDLVKWLEENLR